MFLVELQTSVLLMVHGNVMDIISVLAATQCDDDISLCLDEVGTFQDLQAGMIHNHPAVPMVPVFLYRNITYMTTYLFT